jgi:NAD(P)-dependent dehydrogenase (short-subunit alcohol dehydrogenase family)
VSGSIADLPLLAGKRILVTGAAPWPMPLAAAWPDLPGARRAAIDVTDEAACESCAAQMVSEPGGIDGLFNSAGVADPVQPALEVDIEAWQRTVNVHLRGSFCIARAAGRVMVERGSGSIVLVSSVNGVSGIPRRHAYGPAKAAIAQLARTLTCEWAASQVRPDLHQHPDDPAIDP